MARRQKDGSKRAAKVKKRNTKNAKKSQGSSTPHVPHQDELSVAELPFNIPDRRIIERDMWGTFDRRPMSPEQAEADQLYAQALESTSPSRQLDLATRAMELDPEHIDARVLVIERTPEPELALGLADETVEFAATLLGPETFEQYVGDFWGLHETRPYMRARLVLVNRLIDAARMSEAIDHMRDMLRLNPGDNQGVRWILLEILLRVGDWDATDELFAAYPDEGSVGFQFTHVLTEFRREGDTPRVRQLLQDAIECNEHVVSLLTGAEPTRYESFGMLTWGGKDEAHVYSQQFLAIWKSTPGAISWLRKTVPQPAAEDFHDSDLQPVADPEKEIRRLRPLVKQLPVSDESWLCIAEGNPDDEVLNVIVVSSQSPAQILEVDPGPHKQSAVVLAELMKLMAEPESDEARRPAEIHFVDTTLLRQLTRRLPALGVEALLCEDREPVLEMIGQMKRQMSGEADDDDTPLQDLPSEPAAVWEFAWQQFGIWVPNEDGQPVQPWAVIVADATRDLILWNDMKIDEPDIEALTRTLSQAMRVPAVGEPCRPGCVRVRTQDDRLMIADFLEDCGIECVVGTSHAIDEMLESLESHLTSGDERAIAALMDNPELSPPLIGELFNTSVDYYRAAPWGQVRAEDIVEIRCPELSDHAWYALVMGQMGMELGMMLHADPQSLSLLFQDEDDINAGPSPAEVAKLNGVGFSFNEKTFMAPADVSAAEFFGWPVAGAEAWPLTYFVAGGEPRDVTAEELTLLIAALRIVPPFWKQQRGLLRDMQSTQETLTIADRTLQFEVSRFGLRP